MSMASYRKALRACSDDKLYGQTIKLVSIMIKAEATVVGTVTQSAQLRSSERGDNFEITLKTAIPQKEGGTKEIYLFIKEPGSSPVGLRSVTSGQRVNVQGTIVFHKKDDNLYLNMNAVNVSIVTDNNVPDSVEGTLMMIGIVGSKAPEVRQGKNGKPFMNFSAYSGEGEQDNRIFTWVRFVRFNGEVEPFLTPKSLIEATGAMELQCYQDKLSIGCRLADVKPYLKKTASDESV